MSENWGAVLAGGRGRRLAAFVEETCGQSVPKQFAPLDHGRSLLERTVERIGPLLPGRRTIVVVCHAFRELAREQLRAYPDVEIIAQPRSAGTAPGLLLPLARIRSRAPGATVTIFPSDHFVPHPRPFLAAVRAAARAVDASPERVVLLGIDPEGPETEYGWIVPGRTGRERPGGAVEVRRFVEKPDAASAGRLLRDGALWNSFVSVGRVATYWRLARSLLPRQTELFERYAASLGTGEEERTLESVYERMEPADFSRAVLCRARELMVVRVRGSGWSDWGSPERVRRDLDCVAGAAAPDRTRRDAGGVASAEAPVRTRRSPDAVGAGAAPGRDVAGRSAGRAGIANNQPTEESTR